MLDPSSTLAALTAFVAANAPLWLYAIRGTFLDESKKVAVEKGKEFAFEKSSKLIDRIFRLDEKEQIRHLKQALKNATERGIAKFQTSEEQAHYRSIIATLSQKGSPVEALLRETLQLFTLSDSPDLTILNKIYNEQQLAQNKSYTNIDITPYLASFFDALKAELYADPFFRQQLSDILQLHAAENTQRSVMEVISVFRQIGEALADNYTVEQFARDIEAYTAHIERTQRYLKIIGVVSQAEFKDSELNDIFVPSHFSLQEGWESQAEYNQSITFLENPSYWVLLGGPGSGKSTVTRYLAWLHAAANLPDPSLFSNDWLLAGKPLPLRIELRRLNEDRRQRPDYDFLTYATEILLGRTGVHVDRRMFESLLERRTMLLLFDGLDEVTLGERRRLIEEIENFAQTYPGNHILVTSRPVGYEYARISHPLFLHAEIRDFDDEQIRRFLENWYTYVLRLSPLPPSDQQELETLYKILTTNERLQMLAVNPLLLTVMTALHHYRRLPSRRVLVYEYCANLLLGTWAELRETHKKWEIVHISEEDQRACVAHLGFVLHKRSQEKSTAIDNDVPARFISREIERFLEGRSLSPSVAHIETQNFLKMVREEAGLIVERGIDESGEALFGFVHRTFQEYFAAAHIYECYQEEEDPAIISEFLREHLHDPHWSEVILLLLGKLKRTPVSKQLGQIFEGKITSRRSQFTHILQQDLFFIVGCLIDEIVVENKLAEDVLLELDHIVQNSPFPSQRKDAQDRLISLMRTRQYSKLAQRKLMEIIALDTILDVEKRAEVAEFLCNNNTTESIEWKQAMQVLTDLIEKPDLPIEQTFQIARTCYRVNLYKPADDQRIFQTLLYLAQQSELPIEQAIHIAHVLYLSSSPGSMEEQQVNQILYDYAQQADLSMEQIIHVTQVLRQTNVYGYEQAIHILLQLAQRTDLSIEQTIQVAKELYGTSWGGFLERKHRTTMGLRWKIRIHPSVEQTVRAAQALCHSNFKGSALELHAIQVILYLAQKSGFPPREISEELQDFLPVIEELEAKQRATEMLLQLVQRTDLSVEKTIQVVEELYHIGDSKQAAHILLQLAEQPNLTPEHILQVANALYRRRSYHWDEQLGETMKTKATQMLLDLTHGVDIEQVIHVFQAFIEYDVKVNDVNDNGRKQLRDVFLRLAKQPGFPIEQAIRVFQARGWNGGDDERKQLSEMLLCLTKQPDFPIEQAIHVFQALMGQAPHWQPSKGYDEYDDVGKQLHETLLRFADHPNTSIEQGIEIARVLGDTELNFQLILKIIQDQTSTAVQRLLTLFSYLFDDTMIDTTPSEKEFLAALIDTTPSEKEAKEFLAAILQLMESARDDISSTILSSIFLKTTFLSVEFRDEFYKQLRDDIPRFHKLPPLTPTKLI